MKPIFALLGLLAFSDLYATTALADISLSRSDMAIAAIANDEAISSYDVDNRMKFIIITARLSNTPDVIQRIRPQVVRQLIDERLQLQEAGKNDIKVSDAEVNQAMSSVEQERGLPPGTVDKLLAANNLPRSTFTQQIRAQIAWHKLLMKVKPDVKISDEEIRVAALRPTPPPQARHMGALPQEWQIGVISLPVEKASRESEMRKIAEKLVKEVRKGASFEEVSRQFSSSGNGGHIEKFWVKPQQLDPAVGQALVGVTTGAVTDPVRTQEGYTIVKVYDTRSADKATETDSDESQDKQVILKQILLKMKPDAKEKEANLLVQISEDIVKHPGTCKDKGVAGMKNLDDYNIDVSFKTILLSELPPAIKIIAENLQVGEISTPFASDEGIRLYMLCDKKAPGSLPPDRDHVYNMLMQEKMLLEAQKYMRNLRRDAFIEHKA